MEPRSHRSSLISFTPRQRHLGEAAKTAETSNFKNTVGSLKRLVGRSLSDPEIAEFEKKFINAELVDVNGTVGVKVGATTIRFEQGPASRHADTFPGQLPWRARYLHLHPAGRSIP
jgi:molecular chaperone DnaK (HSP70)